jgi:hypothetical protein
MYLGYPDWWMLLPTFTYTPGTSGGGTWVWDTNIIDYGYIPTSFAINAGAFGYSPSGTGGGPETGVMKLNGTTVIPDMSVGTEVFNFPLELGFGVGTTTMEITGASFTGDKYWEFPYFEYFVYFDDIFDNVYWLNPSTHVHLKSSNEAFLARANKKVTAAGDWTLADQNGFYHLWGQKGAVTPLRMSQRNDGEGYTEAHPRMRVNNDRSGASSTSSRVFGEGRNAYDPPAV